MYETLGITERLSWQPKRMIDAGDELRIPLNPFLTILRVMGWFSISFTMIYNLALNIMRGLLNMKELSLFRKIINPQ